MDGMSKAFYILSFVFFPVTMIAMAIMFWIEFPKSCKNKNQKGE